MTHEHPLREAPRAALALDDALSEMRSRAGRMRGSRLLRDGNRENEVTLPYSDLSVRRTRISERGEDAARQAHHRPGVITILAKPTSPMECIGDHSPYGATMRRDDGAGDEEPEAQRALLIGDPECGRRTLVAP